jgi:hypothetical protein
VLTPTRRAQSPTTASNSRAGLAASTNQTPGPGAYYSTPSFTQRSVLSTPPRRMRT